MTHDYAFLSLSSDYESALRSLLGGCHRQRQVFGQNPEISCSKGQLYHPQTASQRKEGTRSAAQRRAIDQATPRGLLRFGIPTPKPGSVGLARAGIPRKNMLKGPPAMTAACLLRGPGPRTSLVDAGIFQSSSWVEQGPAKATQSPGKPVVDMGYFQ